MWLEMYVRVLTCTHALPLQPSLLLLDEPTNHLDVEACVWLEMELKKYARILVVISHSQDFLNNVCTNIIHIHLGKVGPWSVAMDFSVALSPHIWRLLPRSHIL